MWLTSSSIGRKFVMALTGVCLVLFVTFHVLMNSVALLWPVAYNMICEFLGANWYALVASAGLAALFIIHIFYAVWLTVQNRRARGADRYLVNTRPPQVEWSSKNMLVLGIVILAFLVVHMTQFWAKMQLQELVSHELTALPEVAGTPASPAMGTLFLQLAFQQWWTPVVYIIGFVALWFHMNHGFWSMFHTIGWDNNTWINRLKCIGCWWTSIVVLLFTAQAIVFTVRAHDNYYLTNYELQEQYGEFWEARAEAVTTGFEAAAAKVMKSVPENDPAAMQAAQIKFFVEEAPAYVEEAQKVVEYAGKQCPDVSVKAVAQLGRFAQQLEQQIGYAKQLAPQENASNNE
ncbi:MAG: succinate dehydrogenase cytochrome b subunit [Muribaculaceae bacterium]|nr:succinate dehydrogenase cytochrome b subunit [Muribaculaceae bacterium]